MDFGQEELPNSLNKIINGLEGSDQQTIILRLEVLYETVLINWEVPLDAIDLIDHAHKQVIANQNFPQHSHSYQAPLLSGNGQRRRPKFSLLEQ